jgi:hypothetical protein
MKRTVFTRIVLVVLGILIIVGLVSALTALGRAIFGGSSSNSSNNIARESLLTNTFEMSVEMVVRGPITADENFSTVSTSISSSSREVTYYNGYSLYEVEKIELPNTFRAYDEFIYALDKAGFTNGTSSADNSDTRGVCATGSLYEFRIKKNDSIIKTLWTTSCKADKGTLKANIQPIHNLFTAQVSGSSKTMTMR